MKQTPLSPAVSPPQKGVGELCFILASSLFFTVFGNIVFWRKFISLVPLDSVQNITFLISLIVFIFCGMSIIFMLLLWRPWLKPMLISFLLISAVVNYFCDAYGVYIDREMVHNMTRTSGQEALALITPQMLMWVVLLGIFPAIAVLKIRIVPYTSVWRKIFLRFLCICIFAAVALVAVLPLFKDYASFFRNNKQISKLINPVNYMSASYNFSRLYFHGKKPLIQIGLDAKQTSPPTQRKPTLFVLVVGETARAQNFSLYGYERDTNPLLSKQEGVLVFQNTSSCGTNTATSVPCMFSNMPRTSYSASLAARQENVLDVIARAGVEVLWKENNTGCQGICERLGSIRVMDVTPKEECKEDYCFDKSLLNDLDGYIAQYPNSDMVIVLHTIGSHGPSYYRRYSNTLEGQFKPSCDTNQIQTCSAESLMNVYDNTILNTDYFLNETIEMLKGYEDRYSTGMLYLSDHGESLGENGMYLHSAPYMIAPDSQTQVPMIFWSSPEFLAQRKIDATCMQQRASSKAYSQDYLFHTVLGLAYVSTTEYQPKLDLFTPCKEIS